jgi:hypothetical protein
MEEGLRAAPNPIALQPMHGILHLLDHLGHLFGLPGEFIGHRRQFLLINLNYIGHRLLS